MATDHTGRERSLSEPEAELLSALIEKTRIGKLRWEREGFGFPGLTYTAVAKGAGSIALRAELITGSKDWVLSVERVPSAERPKFDVSFRRELADKGLSTEVMWTDSISTPQLQDLSNAVVDQVETRRQKERRVGAAVELVEGL